MFGHGREQRQRFTAAVRVGRATTATVQRCCGKARRGGDPDSLRMWTLTRSRRGRRGLRERCAEFFTRIGRRLTEPMIAAQISRDTWNLAAQRCDDLLNTQQDPVLLHGDLHMGNVLDGGRSRGWVAIDPKACVGDRCFDAVRYPVRAGGRRMRHGWRPAARMVPGRRSCDRDRVPGGRQHGPGGRRTACSRTMTRQPARPCRTDGPVVDREISRWDRNTAPRKRRPAQTRVGAYRVQRRYASIHSAPFGGGSGKGRSRRWIAC